MKQMSLSKAAIATSAFACAALFSFGWSEQTGVSLSIESAQARVGRPLTPVSVAGVARRQDRRAAYGAGVVGAGVAGAAAVGTEPLSPPPNLGVGVVALTQVLVTMVVALMLALVLSERGRLIMVAMVAARTALPEPSTQPLTVWCRSVSNIAGARAKGGSISRLSCA